MKKNKKSKIVLGTAAFTLIAMSSSQFVYAIDLNSEESNSVSTKSNLRINSSKDKDIIVVFDNKKSLEKEKLELIKTNVEIKDEFKTINGLSITASPAEINELQNNPNVKIIEEDVKVYTNAVGVTVNATESVNTNSIHTNADTKDWGINKLNTEQSWDSGYTGKGVKVAVVDTGINTGHSDLKVKGGASFVSYTTSYNDDNGHGSHVGGIIGAKMNGFGTVGAAPDTDLYAVKALDKNGSGYMSDIIAGIDWSITNDMDIVNLSIGSSQGSASLEAVINKAYANDVLIVAAAGNNGAILGQVGKVDYPGQYAKAITVGATNSNNLRALFSSTGSAVDVAAPGQDILSTYHNGNRYVYMSGTSMATPYVAGVLALYKEANPTLKNNELRTLLESNVVDLGSVGKDIYYGHGLVKAPVKVASKSIVTTNKTTYKLGEKLYITTKVTDEEGNILSKANVIIQIKQPNGSILNLKGTTNSSGNLSTVLILPTYFSLGQYTINVTTTKTDYRGSVAGTTFEIK